MNYAERARAVMDIEISGLSRVRNELGQTFDQAVERILACMAQGGKLVVTGMGKNLHIGQKIAATLTSTGSPAVVLHPAEAMHGDLGIIRTGDVLLVLSYSGTSDEVIALLPAARRIGVFIIALTGDPQSLLGRQSDLVVPVTVDREACPFNMAPTTSTTATLALGDALAMVLLEARGFRREDYAKLHPGGAIGRTLLMRVDDIMRTGERVARSTPSTPLREAVLAMTAARSGAVAVVNDDGQLEGIFTDGDLRRLFVEGRPIDSLLVADVMSRNPIRLTLDHLAVDVLSLFEKHQIDDLIIVDDQNRLVGVVDIQDLPKFKIL